jgi:Protein of unknown function (DUF1997)
MTTKFTASQSIEISVPQKPIPIQHYLRQPQRLVSALVDPTRYEQLGEDVFRLKMRPLSFLTVSLQPTVDMRIWSVSNGTINLRSVGCEIRGVDYINQRFNLDLKGYLSPRQISTGAYLLEGKADLEVQVELPPPLAFTPTAILEAAGNGLLKSVLLTVKQRLSHQLLADYHRWVIAQTTEEKVLEDDTNSPFPTPHSPLPY